MALDFPRAQPPIFELKLITSPCVGAVVRIVLSHVCDCLAQRLSKKSFHTDFPECLPSLLLNPVSSCHSFQINLLRS